MTLNDWKDVLLLQTVTQSRSCNSVDLPHGEEKLCYKVFETIVKWNSGISTAYQIKRIISRVYGIEL